MQVFSHFDQKQEGAFALDVLWQHSLATSTCAKRIAQEQQSDRHQEFPDTVRFMLTGKATLEVALQAINEGAISRFFTQPCNPLDLAMTIKQALHQRALMLEAKRLSQVTRKQSAAIEDLERNHPGITQVRRDQHGIIIAEPEDTSIEELLQEMRCAVTRSEGQLNAL